MLALSLKAVYEKREVELISVCAMARRVLGQRGQLILGDEFRIVQQTPDQGGFAIVDRSASENAENIFAEVFNRKAGAIHQK